MTSPSLSFNMDWLDLGLSSPEEAVTAGMLTIAIMKTSSPATFVEGSCMTRHYDLSSKTLLDYARVSAYPMALWLAYYWWRLNYEPYSGESYHWKKAHDLPAIGNGYVWPPLRIVSNGENVSLRILPPPEKGTMADAQYNLNSWSYYRSRKEFEDALDSFVKVTLARLTDMGHGETELHTLWRDLIRERCDGEQVFYRILEASLGHNPDEGPEELINKLADMESTAGRQAVIEIAVGMSKEAANIHKAKDLGDILDLKNQGIPGRFHYKATENSADDQSLEKPWLVGHKKARELRKSLALNGGPIHDTMMAELLDVPLVAISSDEIVRPLSRVNMSLALPADDGRVRFCLHHPARPARRFYLSRLLGEHLLKSNSPDNWLPATFGATWHQKYQRAFASELLCPLEVLNARLAALDDEYEIDSIAREYGMGAAAVMNHWEYNQPKPFDIFEDKYAR